MGWVTIYISGKADFEQAVVYRLSNSGSNFLAGSSNESDLALYWVNDTTTLRDFKKLIGSKTVFKYRLKFYSTVEAFEKDRKSMPNEVIFTETEKVMIGKMKEWEKQSNDLKNHRLLSSANTTAA